MKQTDGNNAQIFITSPLPTGPSDATSPFDVDEAEELVFCCFFREPEDRAEFLKRLKDTAARPVAEEDAGDLADEFDTYLAADNSEEAFFTAARWWVGVQRHTYHVYTLKVGYGPFRSSCVIAFTAMESDTIKENFDRGTAQIQTEQSRIVDAFGLGGFWGEGERREERG